MQQESYHVGRHVAQGPFSLHTSVGLVGWGKEPSNNDVCMEGCVLRGLDLFRVPKRLAGAGILVIIASMNWLKSHMMECRFSQVPR